jgi:hypothetical protein
MSHALVAGTSGAVAAAQLTAFVDRLVDCTEQVVFVFLRVFAVVVISH